MKKLIAALAIGLISLPLHAVITIHSVAGGSYVETTTDNTYTLYGGIAGSCSSTSANSTCNSCTSTSIEPCNTKNIHGNLQISITFSTDKDLSAYRVALSTGDGSSESAIDATTLANVTIAAGSQYTLTTKWGYLCTNDSNINNSTCIPSSASITTFAGGNRKIYVNVDENGDGDFDDTDEKKAVDVKFEYVPTSIPNQNFCTANTGGVTGLCGFELKPGDSKFYLQQIFADSSGTPQPYAGGMDLYGAAFFVAPMAFASITPSSVYPQIKKYDADYYIEDNTLTGLTNYLQYCVLMGNVSKAQNIYVYSNNPVDLNSVCAEPSEVVGMLADKSCFISTAAFGSDMSDQVQIFRDFRNQYLLNNSAGIWFVKKYYEYSPPIANFIGQSEFAKSITRGFLYPFLFFAWLATHYGLVAALSVLSLLVAAVYFAFFKNLQVRKKHVISE